MGSITRLRVKKGAGYKVLTHVKVNGQYKKLKGIKDDGEVYFINVLKVSPTSVTHDLGEAYYLKKKIRVTSSQAFSVEKSGSDADKLRYSISGNVISVWWTDTYGGTATLTIRSGSSSKAVTIERELSSGGNPNRPY